MEIAWSEENSVQFIGSGEILTPARHDIEQTFLELLPARADEAFTVAELGVGGGWLSAAILRQFPAARVVGLDGSPTMLQETARLLAPYQGRFELRPFNLSESDWIGQLEPALRCIVSSLVIHHLDGPAKQQLYRDLASRLESGGALLIADIVAPCSEQERRYMASSWSRVVKEQSLALSGSLAAYQQFLDDHWNWYEHPDPMDMPSTIPEHLRWLEEAGYTGVTVFWQRAGHALYGGYHP